MKRQLVGLAAVLVLGVGSSADAASITLDDKGVVGAADWLAGDNDDSYAPLAQEILDLAKNTTSVCGAPELTDRPCSSNTTYDYSGDLALVDKLEGLDADNGANVVLSGVQLTYDYALAKYDGQNAGVVLFYLPDYGYTIPGLSDTIWTNKKGNGYAISNIRFFNSVPDGGSTAALFGMAILGLGAVRRWMN